MIYRNKGRTIWRARLSLAGQRRDVSLETPHKPQAERRKAMLLALEATVEGEQALRRWLEGRISLADLYDAAQQKKDGLLALLRTSEVNRHSSQELADRWLREQVRLRPATVAFYRGILDTFIAAFPDPLTVTPSQLHAWLEGTGWGAGRWRGAVAVVGMMYRWAMARQMATTNPTAALDLPKPPPPRTAWLDRPHIAQLLDATDDPVLKCAWALAYGAGLERGVIATITAGDVVQSRMLRARGTKTRTRDRIVRVEAWAWPIIQRRLAELQPADRLVPLRPEHLTKQHTLLVAKLGLGDFHLHDARHSWAIRMLKAWVPVEAVSYQLGHANAQMVLRVYGRFVPKAADWEQWEQRGEQSSEPEGSHRLQVVQG